MRARVLAAAALFAAAAFAASKARAPEPLKQPIAFDHARHAEENLGCADCHARANQAQYAGLPSIKQCLLCHKEAQGTNPEEPRIREFAAKGEEIPWVVMNRVVGHVYFSHVAHVRFGEMQCAECHGDMSKQKEPVTASQVEHLTMSRCMQCHEEKHASLDCLACHK